jgi:hypothetical protein
MPALPAAPVRATSFTDFAVNNPGAPPPGDKIDAEYDRSNAAITGIRATLAAILNGDGTLATTAVQAAYAAGAPSSGGTTINVLNAPSALSAKTAQAWAEYLPGILPADVLANSAVTGDHWSSRWWANQAVANIAAFNMSVNGLLLTGGTALGSIYLVQSMNDLTVAQLASLATHLPTSAPSPNVGGLWNNGGVLSVVPGPTAYLASSLPTVQPPPGGGFWNNGGIVCIR